MPAITGRVTQASGGMYMSMNATVSADLVIQRDGRQVSSLTCTGQAQKVAWTASTEEYRTLFEAAMGDFAKSMRSLPCSHPHERTLMRAGSGVLFSLVVVTGGGGYWKASVSVGTGQVEERRRNLGTLRRDGVIGHAEYRQRRQEILQTAFE